MKFIDLTHTFDNQISVYPGGTAPLIKQLNRVETNGFASKEITFTSHQGTHIDGMSHMVAGGKTLNEISLTQFAGTALTIDVREFAGKQIPLAFFQKFEDQLTAIDFVLLYTGWSQHWRKEAYKHDFPTMAAEATSYLCKQNLKGIGMDCFSPDPVGSPDYANHFIAFEKEVLLIENLTNLEELPLEVPIYFQCFPMKIVDADGAPVRAIARIQTEN